MMPVIKQSNLVLHIPFDGQAVDRSASPATGTPAGSGTYVDGKFGKCFQQRPSTTGDYVDWGSPSKTTIAYNAAMTLACWFKHNDASNGAYYHCIASRFGADFGWDLTVYPGNHATYPNKLLFGFGSATSTLQIINDTAMTPDKWYFVVVTKGVGTSYSTAKIYINMATTLVYAAGSSAAFTNYALRTGARASYTGLAAMSLQHLMMWNTELTAQEIRFLYESTKGAYLL